MRAGQVEVEAAACTVHMVAACAAALCLVVEQRQVVL